MDWSAVIAGAIGGAVGAGATGGFTSWRDYRHEHRRLSGAIGMVSVELDQNRERINRFGQDDVKGRLTLGDWASNKATLSEHLEPRNQALWDELVRAYNKIHEARGESGPAPTAEKLGELKKQLDDDRSQLRRGLLRRLLPGSAARPSP